MAENPNPTNLVMGPATVYFGLQGVGTAEPADALINAAPAASAWEDMGITDGGVSFTIDPTFTPFQGDQIVDQLGARLTGRKVMVTAVLSEVVLKNLARASNTSVGATGANFAKFEPNYGPTASQLPYCAILVDGFAPDTATINNRRRLVLRRVLQTGKVELVNKKDAQAGIAVQFEAYYVNKNVAPFAYTDQTAA